MDQKSIQNPSQIDQKSIKIRFGSLLAPSDRPGGILGRLGGILARKRWPTWLQLGPQNGARIEKKSKQKSIKILMPLGVGFLEDFGGFGRVKWSQVGTKIEPRATGILKISKFVKSCSRCGGGLIFGGRGVHFLR